MFAICSIADQAIAMERRPDTSDLDPAAKRHLSALQAAGLGLPSAVFRGRKSLFKLPNTHPLFACMQSGDDAEELKEIIGQSPAYLYCHDESGRTALHHAAAAGHSDCMKALLGAGACPSSYDFSWHTPMHVAVGRDDELAVNLLFESAPLHQTTAIVPYDMLLAQQPNSCGDTPLHLAARHTLHGSLIHTLLMHGADPRFQNNHRQTPAHLFFDKAASWFWSKELGDQLSIHEAEMLRAVHRIGCRLIAAMGPQAATELKDCQGYSAYDRLATYI